MNDRKLTDNQIVELDGIIEEMDLPEVGTSDFHHFAKVHFGVITTSADYDFYLEV